MAVTNTVQGLNSVVDLLKNILDTVKSDSKNVQPKDVSSTTRTTADIGSSISTNNLTALNSINAKTAQNAQSYANIVKTITSKDVISGIKNLALLYKIGVIKIFVNAIELIIEGINKVENIKISAAKLKNFNAFISSIGKLATAMTSAIMSLGKIMLVAAGLGVLFIVSWPFILIGFTGIALIMAGVLLLVKGMIVLQNILFGGAFTPAKAVKNGISVMLFQQMAEIFLSMAALILISAAVGLLAQYAWPQIGIGFVLIGALCFGIVLLFKFMNAIVNEMVGFSKGVGRQGFGLGLEDTKNLIKIATTVTVVAIMIAIMFSLAALVFVAAGVGLLAQHAFPQILIGFGIIVGILFLTIGILKLADFLVNNVLKIGDPGNIKNTLVIVATIGVLIIVMIALSFLIAAAAGVGALVVEYTAEVSAGLRMIMLVLLAMIGIAFILNMLMNSINAKNLLVGLGVVFGLSLVLFALNFAVMAIAKTGKFVTENGGWPMFWKTATSIGGVLLAMVLISYGIGALIQASGGLAGAAIAMGLGIIFGIALTISALAVAIKKVAEVGKIVAEAERTKAFDGLIKGIGRIGLAISTMSATLIPAAASAMLITPAIRPLNKLINIISKFVDILAKVGNNSSFLTPVKLDDEGNVIQTGEKVNIGIVAQNIAKSFITFITNLSTGFANFDGVSKRTMKRVAKAFGAIINPISGFVDTITKVNKETQTKLNDTNIATNIASTFALFINKLDDAFTKDSTFELETNIWGTPKLKKLSVLDGISSAIGGSLELLSKYNVNGNTITITNDDGTTRTVAVNPAGIGTLLTELNTALSGKYENIENFESTSNSLSIISNNLQSIDNVLFKDSNNKLKAIKEYKEALKELNETLKEMGTNIEQISKADFSNLGKANKNQSTQIVQNEVPVTTKHNNSTSVESIQPDSASMSNIADAIKEGLSGATVRFAFADSMEDFIGEMVVS